MNVKKKTLGIYWEATWQTTRSTQTRARHVSCRVYARAATTQARRVRRTRRIKRTHRTRPNCLRVPETETAARPRTSRTRKRARSVAWAEAAQVVTSTTTIPTTLTRTHDVTNVDARVGERRANSARNARANGRPTGPDTWSLFTRRVFISSTMPCSIVCFCSFSPIGFCASSSTRKRSKRRCLGL